MSSFWMMSIGKLSQRVFHNILKWRYSSSPSLGSSLILKRSLGITSSQGHYIATPPSHFHQTHRSLSTVDSSSLVYSGPLTKSVKAIKLLSITTAVCAVTFCPVLIYFGNQATPLIGRIAISSLVTTVGLSTTFILHWFIKCYVAKLYYDRSSDIVSVETFTIFGRKKLYQFHVSEARPPSSVTGFSTFQAGGRHFFMHTEIFEDPELLRKLLGSFSVFEDNAK